MSTRPHVSIRICPTELEQGEDVLDEGRLLYAIKIFVLSRFSHADVDAQIGHSQGVQWARIDGDDEAGMELMEEFWHATGGGSDPELYSPAVEGGAE